MSQSISKLIDEDIDCLLDTLSSFKRMDTDGIDQVSTAYFRSVKSEFIKQTERDLNYMLNFKTKFNDQTL